jgi:succinoglycan biosynthesis transport protein ExoP
VTNNDRLATPEDGQVVPTLLDYMQVLRRRWWIFLLAVVLVPTIAVVLTMLQGPSYKASAQVLLDRTLAESLGGTPATPTDPARKAQTEAELARVPAVASRTIRAARVGKLNPSEFLKSSTVSATLGSDFLTFSVTNSDPDIAKRLATAYAGSYAAYRQDLDMQELKRARVAVQGQIRQLAAAGLKGSADYRSLVQTERRLATLTALKTPSARVVRQADRATKVGPKIIRNEMIGLALGLVLGIALAFLWDALDPRIRSVETLREGLGLRLLGRLPSPQWKLRKENRLVMLAAPLGHEADAFRVLRASFDYANADYQARTIMVTSAVDGEGKSTTVANLAVALARAGRRVVLIDADLRRPSLHRFFDVDERPGLIDVALGHVELEQALRSVPVTQSDSTVANGSRSARRRRGRLEILTAGNAIQAPDELGVELTVAEIAKSLQHHADLVLIDAAPLLPVGDAIALSTHVDALVLVVRLNSLRPSAFDDLRRTLTSTSARKLGFIITGAETSDAYTDVYRYAMPGRRGDAEVPAAYESSRAPDE